ncbi:unnamed protein product, partial [Acanthoscelides obtectus]
SSLLCIYLVFLSCCLYVWLILSDCSACLLERKPCLSTANVQDSVSVWHRFPNPKKFMYVFVQWMDCIGNEAVRDMDPITVYNGYRVCHAHFTEEDNYGNNRLRKDAVPSLNLPDQQISNTTDEIRGSSRTESGLMHKVHVTRETHLSPKAKKLYKIASHLSRANRRLRCRRRLIRCTSSTTAVRNEALQQLDSTVATFIKSQITLASSKSWGCRYSLEDKLMGLILHKQSAEGSEERLRPPSLVNWTVTINGIIEIFEMLEQGNVNHLNYRRLNQDPIANFFGQMSQQGLETPIRLVVILKITSKLY